MEVNADVAQIISDVLADVSTSFEFELACKLFPFSMVYTFQKHKAHL